MRTDLSPLAGLCVPEVTPCRLVGVCVCACKYPQPLLCTGLMRTVSYDARWAWYGRAVRCERGNQQSKRVSVRERLG